MSVLILYLLLILIFLLYSRNTWINFSQWAIMVRKNDDQPENMLDQYCINSIKGLVLSNLFKWIWGRSVSLGSLCYGELQCSRIDLSPVLHERRTGYDDLCSPSTDGAPLYFFSSLNRYASK